MHLKCIQTKFLLQVFVAVGLDCLNKNEGSLHLEIHLKFPTIAKINVFICIPIGSIPDRLLI